MNLRLFAPRYWLTWAGLGLLRLVALLPFGAIVSLGRALGTLLRHLPLSFVRTARRNMELCLPELSPQQREQLLRSTSQVSALRFSRFPSPGGARRSAWRSSSTWRASSTCARRRRAAAA